MQRLRKSTLGVCSLSGSLPGTSTIMTYRRPAASAALISHGISASLRHGGDATGYRSRYEGRINVPEAAYFPATPRADLPGHYNVSRLQTFVLRSSVEEVL